MSVTIVAEIGSNWCPDNGLESCRTLIEAAAEAGADVVKFQDFHPIEKMDRPQWWKERCAPWALCPAYHPQLHRTAALHSLEFVCSVFTHDAVVRAHQESCSIIKIASSEIGNVCLLTWVNWVQGCYPPWSAYPPRAIWLSTGGACSPHQIGLALSRLSFWDVTLLSCISEYPVKRPADLLALFECDQMFGLPVGVSSHIAYPDCLDVVSEVVKRGATVVEAHFRLDGVTPENAPDNGPWSLYPTEFSELVEVVREAENG